MLYWYQKYQTNLPCFSAPCAASTTLCFTSVCSDSVITIVLYCNSISIDELDSKLFTQSYVGLWLIPNQITCSNQSIRYRKKFSTLTNTPTVFSQDDFIIFSWVTNLRCDFPSYEFRDILQLFTLKSCYIIYCKSSKVYLGNSTCKCVLQDFPTFDTYSISQCPSILIFSCKNSVFLLTLKIYLKKCGLVSVHLYIPFVLIAQQTTPHPTFTPTDYFKSFNLTHTYFCTESKLKIQRW